METLTAWARAWRRGLAAAGLCLLTTAHAAPPPARPFEDTLAQRLQACTVCHGAEGRAAPDGYYPRIAGKPAGYLYHQLLNFREGRRHYRLMVQMVDPLDDAYLWTIAEHFAGLNLQPARWPARCRARSSAAAWRTAWTCAMSAGATRPPRSRSTASMAAGSCRCRRAS